MDKNRVYELAIEALERQKARINTEIEIFKSEINGIEATSIKNKTSAKTAKKRRKSAAERKAQSEKMKKIWAKRKSKERRQKTNRT